MQDYGGPIGFRMALAHPERVQAMIIQNAVSHEEGLSPLWAVRRAFWEDRTAHEAEVRTNLLSLEATRKRHVALLQIPSSTILIYGLMSIISSINRGKQTFN